MSELKLSLDDLMGKTSTELSSIAKEADPNALGYVEIDGMIPLSFSITQTLHSCPRKFLLREVNRDGVRENNVALNFGHSFGVGVQTLFETDSINKAMLKAFACWTLDIEAAQASSSRSLWNCLAQIQEFYEGLYVELLEEGWELFYTDDGKSGVELHWIMGMFDKFLWQGHIDLVLRNTKTGEVRVFEMKTSKFASEVADWKNSEQTGIYSLIMGAVLPEVSNFGVDYIIASTKSKPEPIKRLTFQKGAKDMLGILTQMQLDCIAVLNFSNVDHFPKHGKSCKAFGRTCEFFGSCDFMQPPALKKLIDKLNAPSKWRDVIEGDFTESKHEDSIYLATAISEVDFILEYDIVAATISKKVNECVDGEALVITPTIKNLLND